MNCRSCTNTQLRQEQKWQHQLKYHKSNENTVQWKYFEDEANTLDALKYIGIYFFCLLTNTKHNMLFNTPETFVVTRVNNENVGFEQGYRIPLEVSRFQGMYRFQF